MTTILTEVGSDEKVSNTFRCEATIPFNSPVKLSREGRVIVGTTTDSIGWAVPLDAVEAANEFSTSGENYNSGSLVLVKLKDEVLNVTSSAAIIAGDFVKGAAAGKYGPEAGRTKATATVGTVVFAAVDFGTLGNYISIETKTGVAAGAETAVVTGTAPNYAIVITGNATSSIAQVQAAIAADADVAALITASALTTFAADGPDLMTGGTAAATKAVSTEGIALENVSAADTKFRMMRL